MAVFRSIYRAPDGELRKELTQKQVREIIESDQGTLWLDITHSPADREDLTALLTQLGFHPMTIDDALDETH